MFFRVHSQMFSILTRMCAHTRMSECADAFIMLKESKACKVKYEKQKNVEMRGCVML